MIRILITIVLLFTIFSSNAQTQNVINWDRYSITAPEGFAVGKDITNRNDSNAYPPKGVYFQVGPDTGNKAMLPPRILHPDSISNPLIGMIAFSYSDSSLKVYDGLTWKKITKLNLQDVTDNGYRTTLPIWLRNSFTPDFTTLDSGLIISSTQGLNRILGKTSTSGVTTLRLESLSGTNSTYLNLSTSDYSVYNNSASRPINYNGNYRANYTDRSLADWGNVKSVIGDSLRYKSDSSTISNDSLFYWVIGVPYYGGSFSGGSGGTLQQVVENGHTIENEEIEFIGDGGRYNRIGLTYQEMKTNSDTMFMHATGIHFYEGDNYAAVDKYSLTYNNEYGQTSILTPFSLEISQDDHTVSISNNKTTFHTGSHLSSIMPIEGEQGEENTHYLQPKNGTIAHLSDVSDSIAAHSGGGGGGVDTAAVSAIVGDSLEGYLKIKPVFDSTGQKGHITIDTGLLKLRGRLILHTPLDGMSTSMNTTWDNPASNVPLPPTGAGIPLTVVSNIYNRSSTNITSTVNFGFDSTYSGSTVVRGINNFLTMNRNYKNLQDELHSPVMLTYSSFTSPTADSIRGSIPKLTGYYGTVRSGNTVIDRSTGFEWTYDANGVYNKTIGSIMTMDQGIYSRIGFWNRANDTDYWPNGFWSFINTVPSRPSWFAGGLILSNQYVDTGKYKYSFGGVGDSAKLIVDGDAYILPIKGEGLVGIDTNGKLFRDTNSYIKGPIESLPFVPEGELITLTDPNNEQIEAANSVIVITLTTDASIILPDNPPVKSRAILKVFGSANALTITPSSGGTIDEEPNIMMTPKEGRTLLHIGDNEWIILNQ